MLFFLMLICISVFAKHKKHKKKSTCKSNIVSVLMHRTACYGTCQDYYIHINNDGVVTYTGVRFTPDTGIFTKEIPIDNVKSIFDKLTGFQVDTCLDLYPNKIPDLPGLNFDIVYKNKTKKIYCANFGPYFLKDIAKSIDEIGKKTDNNWKLIPKTTKN